MLGINMSKSAAAMLVLIFLTASCIMVARPVSGAPPAGNLWMTKAPMHVARGSLGVAVVNGKIYAIGGCTASGINPNTVGFDYNAKGWIVGTNEEYDPTTDTWTFKASMPTPRYSFAIATYKNKIYCIGGISEYKVPNATFTGVNEVYDPSTDTWETKSPLPSATYNVQANVVNDKIYIFTGTAFWIYDPASDSWVMTPSQVTRNAGGFASTVSDNKIYIIGGYYGTGKLNQIYDIEAENWSLGASPPDFLTGVAAATVGVLAPKRIYVFTEGAANEIYDPENDTWMLGANLPTNRIGFSIAAVNDKLYAIGGTVETYPLGAVIDEIYNDTPIAVNEQYTPLGYGTVPPFVSVVSPKNRNYTSSEVSLNFTVNRLVSWMGYSLDGQDNVTVTGNTTSSGLSNGLHNVTVYARDEFGNTGVSETVWFTVAEASFPATLVAGVSGASVAVVGLGLLVYFKKRKH
jgi:N-acetylneuraminic acid mutarotase